MNSLPSQLIRSLRNIESFNEEAFKQVHESGKQIISIRFNPSKAGQKAKVNGQLQKIPWSSNGYYLPERPSFTLEPIFHAGAYYVQEASSMFLEQALKQTLDLSKLIRVLDLCAAPGGKSTLIQSIISKDSLLVSNEVIKTRVNILSENISKWGSDNVIVSNNDPSDFQRLENYFDTVVVDAPCSGSGLFRKDPGAIEEWSENNVALCAQRQQRILADILPSLKEDGVLIYSTCSYSEEEDEHIADWLINEFGLESIQLVIDDSWGIVETISAKQKAYGYRFYPDKVKGEGFFITVFKKPGSNEGPSGVKTKKPRSKNNADKITIKEIEIIKPWLINANEFFFIRQNDEVIAMPLQAEQDLEIIRSALYIKKAGVKLGTVIRDELVPAHELAISNILAASVPSHELDKETALQYLRREEIKIDNVQKGWVLLTHQKLPIGWVKVISNRINNYYPKDWRILNK